MSEQFFFFFFLVLMLRTGVRALPRLNMCSATKVPVTGYGWHTVPSILNSPALKLGYKCVNVKHKNINSYNCHKNHSVLGGKIKEKLG